MSKLRNLALIGLGYYAYRYYTKKPEKIEEHKELAKQKLDASVSYTKCMLNYTKKNGVVASAQYLKEDLEKVINKTVNKAQVKVEETVAFGKQFADDANKISNNVVELKDQSITLKSNIADSKEVINEVHPAINDYVGESKKIADSIKEKIIGIKDTIINEDVENKINNYKNKVENSIQNAKEKVEEVIKKEKAISNEEK